MSSLFICIQKAIFDIRKLINKQKYAKKFKDSEEKLSNRVGL